MLAHRMSLAEAERLITEEKVVALIGAYQSAVTKTASQAAERPGTVAWKPSPATPDSSNHSSIASRAAE